jgi:hypothetical protein
MRAIRCRGISYHSYYQKFGTGIAPMNQQDDPIPVMRIRILRLPPEAGIDGIRTDCFEVGREYQVGNSIAALFLAEGWAEPMPLDAAAPADPYAADDPFPLDRGKLFRDPPANVVRELYRTVSPKPRTPSPSTPARVLAADFRAKPRRRKHPK